MTAWLALAGAVALVAAAVVQMWERATPSRRDHPSDRGDWPTDQMAP